MKIQNLLIIAFALITTTNSFAAVSINEISAASSDRTLNYSDENYPQLGGGNPWMNINFDDSSWKNGDGGLGYGSGDDATDLQSELQGISVSLYIRQKFIVSAADAAKTNDLRLRVDYDDGFIVFVNGKEIARKNMGPTDAFGFHDQHAYNAHIPGTPENIYYSKASDILVEGTNIIAIQVHNHDVSDGGMSIIADLFINSSPEIQIVRHSDVWSYFVGLAEPSGGIFDPRLTKPDPLHILWGDSDFNDSYWSQGPGGLGYGDGDDTTIVNIQNIAYSLYIRQSFVLIPLTTNSLILTVDYDDAFIACLNGYEIARRNMGAVGEFFAHDRSATDDHEAGSPEIIVLPDAAKFLISGTNVLAIQIQNWTIGSSDMTIKADLSIAGAPSSQLVYYTNIWRYMIGTDEPAAISTSPEQYSDNFIDWLELYNSSPTSINLKGWSLTDDDSKPDKWIFPEISIGADDYLVILCDEQNITSTASGYLNTNFKLAKDGEYLALFDNGNPRKVISGFSPNYPQQSFSHSYGWSPISNSYLYFSIPTPGKQNSGEVFPGIIDPPTIDKSPGFYAPNVIISITSETQNAEIRYTTNGNEPTENSSLYSSALNFNINTVLRARAFKTGWISSKTITRTYLLNQPNDIKNVPIVSIVADSGKSMYKPNGVTSIVGGYWDEYDHDWWKNYTPDDYNIPMQRGRPFERPVSIEFFSYNTNIWAQENCGIRIAGSDFTRPRYVLQDLTGKWDQRPQIGKPQFNVYFRSDYGESVLNFPLIPESKVTEFNSLRLRSGRNDWDNPFVIDEFVRRISINMGQICSKGFLAWLFINGELKGYFNPVERLDERFFQEWYDSNENWDIINHDGPSEGDDIAWNEMLTYFSSHNLENLGNYIEASKMLDIVNYIDYILAESYGGNWDWPNNNWYAARERSDNGLFRFYVWDAEGSFYNGNDITIDSFNQNPDWRPNGGAGLNGEDTPIANIYRRLRYSAEFRLLFADRIQKHYFNNGCMMESNLLKTWFELEDVMTPMLSSFFGESFDRLTRRWIDRRRPYVFRQFSNEKLWPDTRAPYFNQHGGSISSGFEVVIHNTNLVAAGTIYYTTDGSDPRNIGGAFHGSIYSDPISLTKTTQVKARVFDSGSVEWSPICEAVFSVTGSQNIVVTEIMYHPQGGDDFEFIELKNISGSNLDISDLSFVDGITFSFAGSGVTELQNQDYVVVVKSNAVFASLYNTNDILIAGEYEGQLANSGERIEIQGAAGQTLVAFTYSDDWYPETDGDGYSLVIVNPYESTNLWNLQESWRASHFINGSPGEADIPEPGTLWIMTLLATLLIKRNTLLRYGLLVQGVLGAQ